MEANKRKRLGEQGWREVLSRFEASDESVHAFCQREGLKASTLHRWRARLGAAASLPSQGGAQRPMPGAPAKASDTPRAGFVDLGALGALGVASAGGRLEVKLDLGGGVMLHVVRG